VIVRSTKDIELKLEDAAQPARTTPVNFYLTQLGPVRLYSNGVE
jgi:hypothetical protein